MNVKNIFFIKFMIIVSLLFFIPFMVLGVFMFQKFFSVFERNTIKNNTVQMEKVFLDLEQNFSHLNVVTHQIYLDKTLSKYNLVDKPFNRIYAIENLKRLNFLIPYVESLYLVYNSDDFIYSTSAAYQKEAFKEFVLENNPESWEIFNNIISNQKGKTVIFDPFLKKLFIIHMLKGISYSPYGAVIFEISPSFMKSNMEDNAINNVSEFYLLSNKNQIIMSSDLSDNKNVLESLDLGNKFEKSKNEIITIAGVRYFYNYRVSESTGLQYISLTRYSTIMHELITIRRTYFIIIISLGFLGILLMVLNFRFNYLPIQKLRIKSENLIPEELKMDSYTGLEMIHSAINYLTIENESLNEKYTLEKENIARTYLHQLIKGEIQDIKKFSNKAKELNLNLETPYHTICGIHSTSFSSLQDSEYLKLLEFVKKTIGFEHHLIDYRQSNLIVIILNLEEEQIPYDILNQLHNHLKSKCNEVSIGHGNIYNDIFEMPRIYIEATMALENRYIYGTNKILSFNKPDSKNINIDESINQSIKDFKQSIMSCNPEKAQFVLNNIKTTMAESKLAILQCKLVGYDIYRVFRKSVEKIVSDNGIRFNSNLSKDFNTTLSFIELEKEIISGITDIKHLIDSRMSSEKYIKIDKIEEYILGRYKDTQFSLGEVADAFNISQSVLSLLYKEVKGCTISNFLAKLRINEAKRLLIECDLPLDCIASESGYYNNSSFIRRFKQMTGTTPGTFRHQYKKKLKNDIM